MASTSKRFRVMGNFPAINKGGTEVTVVVEAGSWAVALGKAARAMRKQLKSRRVMVLSLMMQQIGHAGDGSVSEAGEVTVQSNLPMNVDADEAATFDDVAASTPETPSEVE